MVLYIYIIKSYETTTKGCFLGGDGIEIETSQLFFFFFFFFFFFLLVFCLCRGREAMPGGSSNTRVTRKFTYRNGM